MRLRSLGLPAAQADELITVFQRWTKESGREWTVSRLKNLKQELISRRSGGSYRAPWVSRKRSDGLPSGIMHYIFKRALSGTDKTFNLMVNVLMVYSTLTLSHASEAQKKKFFGSMMSEDKTGLESTIHATEYFTKRRLNSEELEDEEKASNLVFVPRPKPFVEFCTADMKSAPSVFGSSIRSDDAYGQFIFFANSIPSVDAFFKYPLVFNKIVPLDYFAAAMGPVNSPFTDVWHPLGMLMECRHSVGKIGLIQEPGCKLRAVANPNAVWQAALQPLKAMILRDLKLHYPTDCTHDQDLGARVIQRWLSEGKTCFSVDLSDATNMMPLHLQIQVLRDRYLHGKEQFNPYLDQLISAFEYVSRAPWYYKDDRNGKISLVRFTRGQPLGLQPSFASFALAHNELLLGICKKVGVNPTETFRILGDDIVISDPEVHRRYRLTLKNLGCPVSESKCLQSNQMAEFAGYIITKSNLWHAYKWKNPDWSNLESLLHLYGPKARQLVWGTKREVVDLIAPLPEELGGLGWNPEGIPLTTRLSSDVGRAMLEYSKGESLESYISLTSLLTDFDNQIVEGGGFGQNTLRRVHLARFPEWAASPLVQQTGWLHPDVANSVNESLANRSRVLPQDTILGPALPAGFHQSWLEGYGTVLKRGNISQDPRAPSKRKFLVESLYEALKVSGKWEKSKDKFFNEVNGIRRSHSAQRMMQKIDQSSGPLRSQRIPVKAPMEKKPSGPHLH